MKKGFPHREDKPAIIEYYKNGTVMAKHWKYNDNYLRVNGSSLVTYHKNGRIKNEAWLDGDTYHRLEAPTLITYDENGNVIDKQYWWHGKNINKYVLKIFGNIPNELTKEEQVLIKVSLLDECL